MLMRGFSALAKRVAQPPLLFLYLLRAQTVTVRVATQADIPGIANVNVQTLPENYSHEFYVQHLLNWPHLALVAEAEVPPNPADDSEEAASDGGAPRLVGGTVAGAAASRPRQVVGYVLGRMDLLSPQPGRAYAPSEVQSSRQGHITSLAILPGFRRQGLAADLMHGVHGQMAGAYDARRVSLHVRVSNGAAMRLYRDKLLGYGVARTVPSYYADGEDAHLMRAPLAPREPEAPPQGPAAAKSARGESAAEAAMGSAPLQRGGGAGGRGAALLATTTSLGRDDGGAANARAAASKSPLSA